jgi:hypothetical protein
MLTIELCPSPVFGPSRMRRFGKPGTVVAACTRGLRSHTSASVGPSRPWTTGRSASRRRGSQCRTRVDLELAPAGGDDRALTELADALGDQLDVVAAERRVPSRGGQDALAADRQARGRLRDQLGVAQRAPSACGRPSPAASPSAARRKPSTISSRAAYRFARKGVATATRRQVPPIDALGTLKVALATSLLDGNAWRTRMAYVPWRLAA